ncbi:bola-like protein [Pleomassaria siparia CBS 279.74]|uniref:Bola-like protein n=1 Tax=Pleomassaria siparia CBS 279.74 TaxID=1314801 RepID=A0A6G1KQ80_9PLEO|nr:bola-like protein [Pleomassaria siparia CBS 279.74]
MAPSRALVRFATSAQHRSTPHLLSPACRMRIYTSRRPISALAFVCRNTRASLHPGPLRHSPAFATPRRSYSQIGATAPEPPDYLNEKELHIFNKLKTELQPVQLTVKDISGGCGSMYALEIESTRFKGLSIIKQHKMVNTILAEEIASWHGVQLKTKAA